MKFISLTMSTVAFISSSFASSSLLLSPPPTILTLQHCSNSLASDPNYRWFWSLKSGLFHRCWFVLRPCYRIAVPLFYSPPLPSRIPGLWNCHRCWWMAVSRWRVRSQYPNPYLVLRPTMMRLRRSSSAASGRLSCCYFHPSSDAAAIDGLVYNDRQGAGGAEDG